MKFGLFMLPSWPEPDPKHQSRILGEMMEQIEFAEELGYDSVWLAEHHFTRYGIVPSAVAMGLYAAARTKRIRIGTGVSVLTFHNPVFIAEETALLDALSQGRLDFGVGRGQVVYEYGNLNVDYQTRSERFSEILDVIMGLWKTPGFSYHGDFYNVDDMTIAPVPVQEPHPPVYLAVSRTPESVSVAVDRGLPVLTSANIPDVEALEIRNVYADVCAEKGVAPLWDDMPYFRKVYVGEDEKSAIEDPRDAVTWVYDLNGYRRTLKGGSEIYYDLDQWITNRPEHPPSYESRLETTTCFGTPDQCIKRIRQLRDGHNVHYFGANMSFGTLEHGKVMRSMELFAKEVMPAFG